MESGVVTYYVRSYERLLSELEQDRLRELIRAYPAAAGAFLGELATGYNAAAHSRAPALRVAVLP
ncbi:hypothetical protein [Actinosynnema sp. NPDC020468]|uniref:hypothetical protein n=1 Tax=Actinosynnema sp. NPDC020468 TaxID=3154488 RepID=UPI0033D7D214